MDRTLLTDWLKMRTFKFLVGTFFIVLTLILVTFLGSEMMEVKTSKGLQRVPAYPIAHKFSQAVSLLFGILLDGIQSTAQYNKSNGNRMMPVYIGGFIGSLLAKFTKDGIMETFAVFGWLALIIICLGGSVAGYR